MRHIPLRPTDVDMTSAERLRLDLKQAQCREVASSEATKALPASRGLVSLLR